MYVTRGGFWHHWKSLGKSIGSIRPSWEHLSSPVKMKRLEVLLIDQEIWWVLTNWSKKKKNDTFFFVSSNNNCDNCQMLIASCKVLEYLSVFLILLLPFSSTGGPFSHSFWSSRPFSAWRWTDQACESSTVYAWGHHAEAQPKATAA